MDILHEIQCIVILEIEIEQDQIEWLLFRQGRLGLRFGLNSGDINFHLGGIFLNGAPGKIIGDNDQQRASGQLFCVRLKLAVFLFQHRGEMKLGAFTLRALHPHVTVHHFGELTGNGETKAGAAVSPSGGAIGLTEGVKDFFTHLWADANACIGYGELKLHIVISLVNNLNSRLYLAFFSELHRVANQIKKNLPKSSGITSILTVQRRWDMAV